MGKAKPPTGLEKEFAVKADTAEIVTTQEKPAKKKAWGPVRWIGMLLILVLVCGGMITAYRYFIISAYPLQYEEYVEEAAGIMGGSCADLCRYPYRERVSTRRGF